MAVNALSIGRSALCVRWSGRVRRVISRPWPVWYGAYNDEDLQKERSASGRGEGGKKANPNDAFHNGDDPLNTFHPPHDRWKVYLIAHTSPSSMGSG